MTSMIERVATALADHHDDGLNVGAYLQAARAVIEAMRDPTVEMHASAEEISVYYDDFSCGDGIITLGTPGYPGKFNRVWSELIDAALKEPTT